MTTQSGDPRPREAFPTEQLTRDEGGLRPPEHLRGWRRWWWWFDFLILVKLARLRFIAILVVIGVVITQWDLLTSYYERWTRPAETSAAVDANTEYFCPMHPVIVRTSPKEKCPICFMPLAKRTKGAAHAEALPAGVVNRVQLSPYRVVLAGVETIALERVPLARTINAVGTVDFNERGQKIVAARVAGRIDRLLVNQTGQMVREGEDLALLYSPELSVTIDNLLQSQKSKNEPLVTLAKEKLRLLGVFDDQIEEIVNGGKAVTQLAIRSPIAGHVIRKNVKEGQYVEEGMALYEVADLSTVWIQAQVYEDDMSLLPLSQNHELRPEDVDRIRVVARPRAFPNEEFVGRLAFIYPHLDEGSRSVTVRFEVENPGHKLRPGATAAVTLEVRPPGDTMLAATDESAVATSPSGLLAVPESAVIDTGSQKIVYRQAEAGVFEGVQVELGPKMKSADGVTYYPVLKGLDEGERVVAAGSFLIDAETRLNPAAGSIYFGGSGGAKDASAAIAQARPSTPDDPDVKIHAALAKLSPADRQLAETQRLCPILNSRLGSMGKPVKLTIRGEPIFLCCDACREKALKQGEETVQKVKTLRSQRAGAAKASISAKEANLEREITAELEKLPAADRALAERQRFCVVSEMSRLGSMGIPHKLTLGEETVFLCCEGCESQAKEDTLATLAKLKSLRGKSKQEPTP